ncbi:MAG: hypothetical protein Q9187_004271 [Circinaria calcarea]
MSVHQARPPTQMFPFLSIPAELRFMIYEWLFIGTKVYPLAPRRPPSNLGILRTSKQIRNEATHFLYKRAQFVINTSLYHPDITSPSLELVDSAHRITHLSLTRSHRSKDWDWAEAGFIVVSWYFPNLQSILLDMFQARGLLDDLLRLESNKPAIESGLRNHLSYKLQEIMWLFVIHFSLTILLLPSEVSIQGKNVYQQCPMALSNLRNMIQRLVDAENDREPQKSILVETYPYKRPFNPSPLGPTAPNTHCSKECNAKVTDENDSEKGFRSGITQSGTIA